MEKNVAVSVVYPASRGYVAYKYSQDAPHKTIAMQVTGSGERADFHVLLPHGAHRVLEVRVNSKGVAPEQQSIGNSLYINFSCLLNVPLQIEIRYA